MESTTSRRKETSTSTTEETTRRKVLQELVEMTTRKKESSTTRRRNVGTVRRGSRPPIMSQRSSVRRRLDKSVTQSSAPSSWTPRPRMVRPSYRGAGGRDRAGPTWERKGSALSKKPLRRMKIRGGGPSNRQISKTISVPNQTLLSFQGLLWSPSRGQETLDTPS